MVDVIFVANKQKCVTNKIPSVQRKFCFITNDFSKTYKSNM